MSPKMGSSPQLSADGFHVFEDDIVFIRHGGEYPGPGKWRVRPMVVIRIKKTGKFVLRPCKGTLGCERMPEEVFSNADVARGARTVKIVG